jgi:hypothetical protein
MAIPGCWIHYRQECSSSGTSIRSITHRQAGPKSIWRVDTLPNRSKSSIPVPSVYMYKLRMHPPHHESLFFPACACSCSTICLLQLKKWSVYRFSLIFVHRSVIDVLSAGEEAAWLGHLMPVLAVGAQFPCQTGDSEDDEGEDGSVGLPVGRLSVPTTGRRPDVLGVSVA